MGARKLEPPPVRPIFPEDGLNGKDEFKIIGNPDYRRWVDAMEMWRHKTISMLPGIREEIKQAEARGDADLVRRLQGEYDAVLKLLSQS